MTLAFFVLIQCRSVTDRQTDGQTDIPPLAIPAVCIARYANALVIKPPKNKLLPFWGLGYFGVILTRLLPPEDIYHAYFLYILCFLSFW